MKLRYFHGLKCFSGASPARVLLYEQFSSLRQFQLAHVFQRDTSNSKAREMGNKTGEIYMFTEKPQQSDMRLSSQMCD